MGNEPDEDIESLEEQVNLDEFEKSMRIMFSGFERDAILDDETWDLFRRYNASDLASDHPEPLDEDDLLLKASYFDFDDEKTLRRLKLGAEWEPDIPSEDTIIRRYMTFNRLVSLVMNGGFWMANISSFPDHFEATLPQPSVNHLQNFADVAEDWGENQETYGVKVRREKDKHTYVNCWRIGEDESAVFWNAYTGGEDGLAIQTTVGDLRENLTGPVWDGYIDTLIEEGTTSAIREFEKILIGEVEYLDYDDSPFSNSKISPARFFHKRNAFEDEQEFRIVKTVPPLTSVSHLPDPIDGLILKGDLEKIISKIILSPNISNKYQKLVEIYAKHNLDAKVEQSKLTKPTHSVDLG